MGREHILQTSSLHPSWQLRWRDRIRIKQEAEEKRRKLLPPIRFCLRGGSGAGLVRLCQKPWGAPWENPMGLTFSRPKYFSRKKKVTLGSLPEDLLLDILSLVPKKDLILHCRLVCSQWRDLVDLPILWRHKCRLLGFHPPRPESDARDWKAFYFHCSRRNLVKNPCGEEGLDSWTLNELQWTTTQDIIGTHLTRFHESCPGLPRPLPDVQKCFTLIYVPGLNSQLSIKNQRITLRDEGYSDYLMDQIRPDIVVKDWFYTPFLAHCQLCVKLLAEDFTILQQHCLASTNEEWNEVSYTFENYPAGVRYIDL